MPDDEGIIVDFGFINELDDIEDKTLDALSVLQEIEKDIQLSPNKQGELYDYITETGTKASLKELRDHVRFIYSKFVEAEDKEIDIKIDVMTELEGTDKIRAEVMGVFNELIYRKYRPEETIDSLTHIADFIVENISDTIKAHREEALLNAQDKGIPFSEGSKLTDRDLSGTLERDERGNVLPSYVSDKNRELLEDATIFTIPELAIDPTMEEDLYKLMKEYAEDEYDFSDIEEFNREKREFNVSELIEATLANEDILGVPIDELDTILNGISDAVREKSDTFDEFYPFVPIRDELFKHEEIIDRAKERWARTRDLLRSDNTKRWLATPRILEAVLDTMERVGGEFGQDEALDIFENDPEFFTEGAKDIETVLGRVFEMTERVQHDPSRIMEPSINLDELPIRGLIPTSSKILHTPMNEFIESDVLFRGVAYRPDIEPDSKDTNFDYINELMTEGAKKVTMDFQHFVTENPFVADKYAQGNFVLELDASKMGNIYLDPDIVTGIGTTYHERLWYQYIVDRVPAEAIRAFWFTEDSFRKYVFDDDDYEGEFPEDFDPTEFDMGDDVMGRKFKFRATPAQIRTLRTKGEVDIPAIVGEVQNKLEIKLGVMLNDNFVEDSKTIINTYIKDYVLRLLETTI